MLIKVDTFLTPRFFHRVSSDTNVTRNFPTHPQTDGLSNPLPEGQ